MNILIISALHPYKVAGTVAYNINKGLKIKGHQTKLIVKANGKYADEDIICMESYSSKQFARFLDKGKRIINTVIKIIKKRDSNYCFQDLNQTVKYYKTKDILKKVTFNPDIILYLFPGKFLNEKNLYELNKITKAPIFWYLMDSAALTGGCHYSWNCNGYMIGCGNCPALYSDSADDQSAINFKFKQEYLSKTDISIIAPTEWQYQMSLKSLLFKEKPIHKVLLTVDPVLFCRAPKAEAKKKFNIEAKKKVIFFGCVLLDEKRKGIQYLTEAFKILKQTNEKYLDDILLLVAGKNFELIKSELPFEYKYLGLLENNEELAFAFQASDIFVCPSIEDSGPMMINQATMSGLPVVSFEMGVSFDLVVPNKTGYIAKLKDSNDLAMGISTMLSLDKETYEQYAQNSRQLALQTCTPDIQIEKIEKLFLK